MYGHADERELLSEAKNGASVGHNSPMHETSFETINRRAIGLTFRAESRRYDPRAVNDA